MDPAGGVEDPGAPQSHLRDSHTSLDGHGPTTGSTGRAAAIILINSSLPARDPNLVEAHHLSGPLRQCRDDGNV